MSNAVPAFISQLVKKGTYYFLDMTLKPEIHLGVVCGGYEVCEPLYRVDREDFDYFSIEFVAGGRGSVSFSGKTYPLEVGTLFYYGPGIAHSIVSDPASPLEKYFVDFTGIDCARLLSIPPWGPLEPFNVDDRLRVRDIFEQLQYLGERRSPHGATVAALLLEQLVLTAADDSIAAEDFQSRAWSAYKSCRELIEDQCLRLRSLKDIALACNLSEAYICRVFQRFDHESPYKVLMRLKMNRAAALLRHSNLLVKDVVEKVGMVDPYHFSKVFKRVHGFSPAILRTRSKR